VLTLTATFQGPQSSAEPAAPAGAVGVVVEAPAKLMGLSQARRAMLVVVVAVALFVLALVPRLLSLDQHATADEDLTLTRSANVALALASHDWWGTYQIGHPEATVEMVVALALGPDALRPYAGQFLGPDARTAAWKPGYFDTLVQARRVMAPIHATLIVVIALLVWRLWGVLPGVLTGLLLALEPFMVAHGRILRTDALLSELLPTAMLAAVVFWSGRGGGWALALSALATGLALLTKTPALALLAAVPMAAIAAPSPQPPPPHSGRGGIIRRLLSTAYCLLAWLVGSVVTAAVLWPAMWVRPLRAIERMAVYTEEKGGSAMDAGGFFLGSPITDPGPLYYVPVLLLRLGPIVLIGLIVWLWLRGPGARRGVGLTLAVGLGLAVVLSFLPKKADRYVLPAMPFLAIVAAVGLSALATHWRRPGVLMMVGGVVAGQTALLAMVWPYPIAFYDPLLGGGTTATRLISVGWGEGLDQVARSLNALPGANRLTVSSTYPEVLEAQFVGHAVDLDAYDVADYVVTYVAENQRHLTDPALDEAIAARQPIAKATIAGVPYAAVYPLDPPAFGLAVGGGGALRLRQIQVSPSFTTRGGTVSVQLAWEEAVASSTPPADLEAEIGLIDSGDGTPATSVIVPIETDGQARTWTLKAPDRRDKFVLAMRLRDRQTGQWLPVTSWPIGPWHDPDRVVFHSAWVRVQ
jgi:4-amino-4-deoxy-L-arabinose transferase-like glycosyltransferase